VKEKPIGLFIDLISYQ